MSAESDLYRRAIRLSSIALVGLAAVGAAVGAVLDGSAGAIAAVVGAAVAALGAISTQVAMLIGHTRSPQALAGIVLFAFLGKMLILIVALLVLQGIDGFNRPIFAVVTITCLVATLAIEVDALRRARVPYVDPGT